MRQNIGDLPIAQPKFGFPEAVCVPAQEQKQSERKQEVERELYNLVEVENNHQC